MPTVPVPVQSSMIQSVGWEQTPAREHGVLTVTFKNGRDYQYDDVPEDEFTALVNAQSVGKYFIDNIKDQFRTR